MSQAKLTKKIAIITGASSGLGLEFARQVEKAYYLDEIWLIARRSEPMKDVADRFHKSKGIILPLDITDRGDMLALHKRIMDEKPQIEVLVNNAGYGKIGPFAELGLEEQMQMIDLNVRGLTYLTHIVLPFMQSGAKIVQVASAAAFSPSPYFSVYAATKSYVLSLSEALHFELKGRGIEVLAVCPGPIATEFFSVAQKNEYMKNKVGQAEPFNRFLVVGAKDVVAKALVDLNKGRKRSVFSLPIKAFVSIVPFLPRSLVLRALSMRKQ